MAKRKEPEEDSKDSGFYKEIVVSTTQVEANVGCSKDSLDVKLAEGGTSRKESNEEGVGKFGPSRDYWNHWEAEAIWKLLANAGYTTW